MRSAIHRTLHLRFGDRKTLLDRRAFLRTSLAAAAGAYLSGCSGFGQRRQGSGRPRVLVAGGGFGGLACAYELTGTGYDVTVLEARKRLGGRVHTLENLVPGRTVEAGASLIGLNHHTWLRYAERFGLDLIDVTLEPDGLDIPIVLGGHRLEPAEAERLYDSLTVFEEALARDSEQVVEWRTPWTSPGADVLDHTPLSERIDGLDLGPRERRLVEILEANNNVRPTSGQSLLGMLSAVRAGGGEAYFTDSEIFRCRGGNSRLTRALVGELGDRLRPGVAVTRIEWSDELVRATDSTGGVHEVDHLVLAAPPSTWDEIRFEPSLPAELKPTLGPAVKVLAPVDAAYWERDGWSQYGLSDGAIAMTWDGTYRQSDAPPACLVGFSGAGAAEELLAVPKDERQGFFADRFDEFFPGYRRHRTGDAAFVRWPEDPWTRTGYSCPAPGTVTSVSPLLHRGLGRLHFAGEHASPGFFGYMEGALESGARLALRIARADGFAAPAVAEGAVADAA